MKKIYLAIVLIVMVIFLALYFGYQSSTIRIGIAEDNFPILVSGMNKNGKELQLRDGTYAIYAKSGKGTVSVNQVSYALDDSLYRKAEKQPGSAKNAVLYEESIKVSINEKTNISVIGDKTFSVSFIKR